MEVTVEEAALTINDALRYTLVVEDSDYTQKVKSTIEILTAEGCSVVKFRNAWDGDEYKGINVAFEAKNGTIFEIQFHSPQSYDINHFQTHPYYEIIRSDTATEAEKEEAHRMQKELMGKCSIPEGALEIKFTPAK